jgi:hypothetical protein
MLICSFVQSRAYNYQREDSSVKIKESKQFLEKLYLFIVSNFFVSKKVIFLNLSSNFRNQNDNEIIITRIWKQQGQETVFVCGKYVAILSENIKRLEKTII